MSLTAITWLESATRKFFINSTYIISRKDSNVFGSGGQNESNSHQLIRISEKKILMNSKQKMCKISESNVFGLRRPK